MQRGPLNVKMVDGRHFEKPLNCNIYALTFDHFDEILHGDAY